MVKVIKFFILAIFFITGDLFSQSKTSNPALGLDIKPPPPQANHNDGFQDERYLELSSYQKIYSTRIEGMTYYEDGLQNYLDKSYIDLLKKHYVAALKKYPKCTNKEMCNDLSTQRLASLVGTSYKAKYKHPPKYPQKALEDGTSGYVIVAFDINTDGTVKNVYKVRSQCTYPSGERKANCKVFDNATLRAAEKLQYFPVMIDGTAISLKDIPHKYTYGFEGQDRSAVIDYPKRILRKVQNFTEKQQWVLLEDYARDLHGRYELRYYWIAEAQFHKNNFKNAKLNYRRLISFNSVADKVKGSAKERLLQISYLQNSFSEEEVSYCDDPGRSYVRNYLCGLNFLATGDSISGVSSLIGSLIDMENNNGLVDEGLKTTIKELIEGQRDYLAQDLSKLN
tara:strand:+ start:337 stop:1524 length:1188 start_codon:yes stop_codon:yes gene_type:complete